MKALNLLLLLCILGLFMVSAANAETLDLSQFADGELQEAEIWTGDGNGIPQTGKWYQRMDGSDWRYQPDGAVIVTVSATGDVTIGGDRRKKGTNVFDKQLSKEPSGLAFPMENVRQIFAEDDLTLVNFEGTLTNTKSATKNTYSFAAPPEYVEVLTSGNIEAVSLENNHVMDHGEQGYMDTCTALKNAGILYSGHLGPAVYLTETGVRIGMLAYQTFNGNYKNIYASIESDIASLRSQGCDLVIVSYHWGEEKDYVPNERQVPLGHATIDAGADVVLGHHSHRINPIELYHGKLICYSLGNFSFAGNVRPDDMDTFIFQQRFRVIPGRSAEWIDFRIIPCSISSQEKFNDFRPTPKLGEEADKVVGRLLELNPKFEKMHKKLEVEAIKTYPLYWNWQF